MCQEPSPDWIVSDDELTRLTDLFIRFEGASDPRSINCREAESEFNASIERLYLEKVAPKFQSLTLAHFRCYARYQCRLRASKGHPPCV